MHSVERFMREEEELTARYYSITKEYEKVENKPSLEKDYSNINVRLFMLLLKTEIFLHRENVRRLIDAKQRIAELEQQISAQTSCSNPAAADCRPEEAADLRDQRSPA